MAVTVRCPKCSKTLNAPDAARGKAVKCPECDAKVPVPAADAPAKAGSAPSKSSAKSKVSKKSAASDADFLARLDVDGVEDEKIRLCPKCGAHLSEEDDECPECGVSTRTGQLTRRERRRRSRTGPDTSHFWGDAWTVPWEFLKDHWALPIRLAIMLSVFSTIVTFAMFCFGRYCDLVNSPPPAVFWLGVAAFFGIGIPGMSFAVMEKIVFHSMEERDKDFRAPFDIFAALAAGVKYIAWFALMPLPFLWTGVAALLPSLVFPAGVVHMTRPYPHPAWLPWDMTKVFFKTAGPCLYLLVINLAVSIPSLAAAAVLSIFQDRIVLQLSSWLTSATKWILSLMGNQSTTGLMFESTMILLVLIGAFITAVPYFLLVCFPQVFVMRAIGEFGYYFKTKLDLINKLPKHQLAGFWPRYLAFMIDALLNGIILAAFFGIWYAQMRAYMYFNSMSMRDYMASPMVYSSAGVIGLAALGVSLFYWASAESSAVQGSLGMRSIGLKVTDMKGNRISFGTAAKRFFVRLVGGIPLGLGFIICAFTEKKQTLHDLATKTLVVWEGD